MPAPSVHNKGVSLLLVFVWKAPDPIDFTVPASWRGGWTSMLGTLPPSSTDFALVVPLDHSEQWAFLPLSQSLQGVKNPGGQGRIRPTG